MYTPLSLFSILFLLFISFNTYTNASTTIRSRSSKHHNNIHLLQQLTSGTTTTTPLTFQLDVGGFQNTFYRDTTIGCQVLFTSTTSQSPVQRFLTAFPDGNRYVCLFWCDWFFYRCFV
jgi:hypothetical protein